MKEIFLSLIHAFLVTACSYAFRLAGELNFTFVSHKEHLPYNYHYVLLYKYLLKFNKSMFSDDGSHVILG